MKKSVALILVLLLTFTGGITAFAATETALKDIAGTKYEKAVSELVTKNIISGYEDQTFKPENAINRAEACIVVVKAMGASDADLTAAKSSGFTDLSGFSWAEKYINYAAAKGIVSGYGDGKFKPSGNVTYNEMAAMLVNAAGVKASELTGSWPKNYVAKATEMGMFAAVIPADKAFDTGAAAVRGDVALMTYAVADKIAQANKAPAGDSTTGGGVTTTTPAVTVTTPAINTTGSGVSSTGSLKDYTGNATGMINETSKVINKDGESVAQIEFLMKNETMLLNTDGKVDVDHLQYDGSVYTLKMQNGVVKDVSATGGKLKNFKDLTSDQDGKLVAKREDRIITFNDGSKLTIMNNAVIYEAKLSGDSIESYKSSSLSSVTKDSIIRAYDVTDDGTDNADIVVIIS